MTQNPLRWLVVAGLAVMPALTLSAGAQGQARVAVTYQQPEKFTDIRDGNFESDRGRQHTLDQLRQHIEKRGATTLPAGYTLVVVVTDVDLAGDYEPWRTKLSDVRVVRNIYPPRISLQYTLTDAAGRVVAESSRELRDAAFLQALAIDRSDTLRFEKALIDSWLHTDVRRAARPERPDFLFAPAASPPRLAAVFIARGPGQRLLLFPSG